MILRVILVIGLLIVFWTIIGIIVGIVNDYRDIKDEFDSKD